MSRHAFSSPDAPKALGPYSAAVEAEPFVYLAGQTPVDPATGRLVEGDIAVQTNQVFDNLFAVLASAGLGPADVVKVNVYLTDIANDFAAMNAAYAERFESPYPARTTVCVAGLPMGANVEIELVARRPT
ncbi:MAG: RidA family protein [Acidimicrobiia bacterium]